MGVDKIYGVPGPLHERALEAFRKGDALGILCTASNEQALDIVLLNARALRDRGIYEEALLEAYIGTRANWSRWSVKDLRQLFKMADREKLLAAGDPLPPGDTFTLYRGVSGAPRRRRPKGLSWTSSPEKAEWFASRLPLPDPAVYRATVRREDVLAYSNGRSEEDFLVWVEKPELHCELEPRWPV